MRYFKLILVTIVCLLSMRSYAQDPQFSQYMFNNLYNNPAYAGVEGYTKAMVMHRTQWLGYNPSNDPRGGLNTQIFTLSSPINRLRTGFGFHVLADQPTSALNYVQIQASGAYHLGIKNTKLSIGFRGGVISQTIDKDQYRTIDDNDPVVLNSAATQVRPDFSMGLHFQSQQLYLGVALNHMIEAEFQFGSDANRNPYPRSLMFTSGYTFPLSYDVSITPSVLVRSVEFSSYTFDISVMATYQEKIWGGLSFRQSEAAILMAGYSFFKENSLKVGYAFDYTFIAQEAKSPTSHELMISYRLPAISTSGNKVVRTPRFRH